MKANQGIKRTKCLNGNAIFSPSLRYRYRLTRQIVDRKKNSSKCLFIMFNPSTADMMEDDNTVRRCIGYTRKWGLGELIIVNLFAYRTTDSKVILEIHNPVGPENMKVILDAINYTTIVDSLNVKPGPVVCAWGAHGGYRKQDFTILTLIASCNVTPFYLKLTKDGFPSHPLYLSKDLDLTLWRNFLTMTH